MASIVSNLRINNQPVISSTTAIRITDGFPTISWDIDGGTAIVANSGEIQSEESIGQSEYDIRIGSSFSFWGFNGFTGDIASTTPVSSSSFSWQHTSWNLERGNVYYGQIRLTDDYSETGEWYKFSFKYNSLPVVTGVSISPSSPSSQTEISVGYDFSDEDGDLESDIKIRWFRNGTHERQLDGYLNVSSSYPENGDEWTVEVTPFDGYEFGIVSSSPSVIIADTETATISGVALFPNSPTPMDPISVSYSYDGVLDVHTRWYVNENLFPDANDHTLYRFNSSAGDIIRCDVYTSNISDAISSNSVEISTATCRVHNIRINEEAENVSVSLGSLNVSWDAILPDGQSVKYISISLGTSPGGNDVYSGVSAVSNNAYTLPHGLVQNGRDYYIDLQGGNTEYNMGPVQSSHFRTTGSAWESSVSNTTGWTVEFVCRVTSDYQGIRLADGSKFLEVRVYGDKIVSISDSSSSKEFAANLEDEFRTITVAGQGSKYLVYLDRSLVIDGDGLLSNSTTDKLLEFGSIGAAGEVDYKAVRYSVDGAYLPDVGTAINQFTMSNIIELPGTEITALSSHDGSVFFAAKSPNGVDIYKYDTDAPSVWKSAANKTFSAVNNIVSSPDGKYIYCCHSNGATVFHGYPIASYDQTLDFTESNDLPSGGGWTPYMSGVFLESASADGLVIDTTDGGKWYYAQNKPGTVWFDNVSSTDGWTVDFSLKVVSVAHNPAAIDTDASDGTGIYVNDGEFFETIQFFDDRISFANSGVDVPLDTTVLRDYRAIGRNGTIELYQKPTADVSYTKIMQAALSFRGTMESSGQSSSMAVTTDGITHAVWSDSSGNSGCSLYYSFFDEGQWSTPRMIVDNSWDARRPSLSTSGNSLYVFFESKTKPYSTVAMTVKSEYGWGPVTVVVDHGTDAIRPKVSIIATDVYVVWEDYRHITPSIYTISMGLTDGVWSEDQMVSSNIRSCGSPSIDSNGSVVAFAWTATDETSIIQGRTKTSGVWGDIVDISDDEVGNGSSDLAILGSNIWVVWERPSAKAVARSKRNLAMVEVSAPANLFTGSVEYSSPRISVTTDTSKLVVMSSLHSRAAITSIVSNSTAADTWNSSADIVFPSTRYSAFSVAPKRFSGNLMFSYESESTSNIDVQPPATFGVIRGGSVTVGSVTLDEDTDYLIGGQLPRREIRFGSFSDSYLCEYQFKSISLYMKGNVIPMEIGLVSTGTASVHSDKSFDALVNNHGDAWIASNKGLSFYFRDISKVSLFDSYGIPPQPVHSLTMISDGLIFAATESGIFVSEDHVNWEESSIVASGTIHELYSLSDGTIAVSTDSGLVISNVSGTDSKTLDDTSGLPSNTVYATAEDSNGAIWACTSAGLVKIIGGEVSFVYDTSNSGLSSSVIYDISIRSDSIRYLATAGGVFQMSGENITRIVAKEDTVWNSNAKSIKFVSPNILWVSSLSNISVIQLNDITGIHSSVVFDLASYSLGTYSYDDMKTYYISDSMDDVNTDSVAEVYVNGLIVKNGYEISSDRSIVRFECPLIPSDIVSVKFRNDISLYHSLKQNLAELSAVGFKDKKINKMISSGGSLFAITDIDSSSHLLMNNTEEDAGPAYDTIILDTTPPTGVLEVREQISRHQLLMGISEAADNLSGISGMVISNYPNFTTDGVTAQPVIPYSTQHSHTLDTSFDTGVAVKTFGAVDGSGEKIKSFISGNVSSVLIGTSGPAKLWKYNIAGKSWDDTILIAGTQQSYFDNNANASIDFVEIFGSTLYVGVGRTGGSTRIYSSPDAIQFTLIGTLSAPHATAATVFNNKMYIGDSSGRIWPFDGVSFGSAVITGTSSVNSLVGYNGLLYAGCTASSGGRVVVIDVNTSSQQIILTTADSIISAVGIMQGAVESSIYAGTGATGKIYRRGVSSTVFGVSYSGTAVSISRIRQGDANDVVAASVGDTVFQQYVINGSLSSWQRIGRFVGETVKDFYFIVNSGDSTKYDLWVVTDDHVYQMEPASLTEKKVYLKLIDGAGNETDSSLYASVTVSDLINFVNQNRLLTLNGSTGSQIDVFQGTSPFYTGQKVEEESGIYTSEVFFGTNNLVAWETLSFDCDTPVGTSVTIYLRAAASRDAVQTAAWDVDFDQSYKTGVNIAFLQGKYIQFKAVLSSTEADTSPVLRSVTIQSRASESTHFYSTNFVLGSRVTRGILTAKTIIPVSAEIVFGISTTNSTDFNDYQIIDADKVFTSDSTQTGDGLRVGIKFITPTPTVYSAELPTVGPSLEPLFLNVINQTFTAITTGNYTFAIDFYEYQDLALTSAVYSVNSGEDVSGFVVNEEAVTSEDVVTLALGSSNTLLYVIPAESGIGCGTFYRTKVMVYCDDVLVSTDTSHVFENTCNTSYVDNIEFPYVPSASHMFQFRVGVYRDAERTSSSLLKTYYTGLGFPPDSTGYWKADGASLPITGVSLTGGVASTILLHPQLDQLESEEIYHLRVDAFNLSTSEWTNISCSWTYRISDPVSDISCGGVSNVPIVTGMAMSFKLEDGRLITLNT